MAKLIGLLWGWMLGWDSCLEGGRGYFCEDGCDGNDAVNSDGGR